MKKRSPRKRIDVNFSSGNYKLTSRALNFNFKQWRENQGLSQQQAAIILGASFKTYMQWERYGVASMMTPILYARMIDFIYEMRKESPGAFDQFLWAVIRVEERSKDLSKNLEHATLVRAREKASRRQAQPQGLDTMMDELETSLKRQE